MRRDPVNVSSTEPGQVVDLDEINAIDDPMQRIEAKLDLVLLVLALDDDDEDDEPTTDLEGNVVGGPRDQNEPL